MPRLKPGQIIRMPGGEVMRVLRVSDCSATIAPVESKVRTIKTLEGKVSFQAPGLVSNISPNSEVEIMGAGSVPTPAAGPEQKELAI